MADFLRQIVSPDDIRRTGIFFRIFQELLTNVVRHSKATRVEIELRVEDDDLILRVADNGAGFSTADGPTRKSLGILGMQERAAQVGGTLTTESAPAGGTTVIVRIPLADDTEGTSNADRTEIADLPS